jgi:hypothetical protein
LQLLEALDEFAFDERVRAQRELKFLRIRAKPAGMLRLAGCRHKRAARSARSDGHGNAQTGAPRSVLLELATVAAKHMVVIIFNVTPLHSRLMIVRASTSEARGKARRGKMG